MSHAPRMTSTELLARRVIGLSYEDRSSVSAPETADDDLVKVVEMMAALASSHAS